MTAPTENSATVDLSNECHQHVVSLHSPMLAGECVEHLCPGQVKSSEEVMRKTKEL